MTNRKLSILFQKAVELVFWKTQKVNHSFFGQMTDAGNYYECRRIFKPLNELVEIGLEKTEPNLDKKQIEFFRWIEINYDLIIKKISSSLENEIKVMIPNYELSDFKTDFRLSYLYIPKCETNIFNWEIGFDEINLLQHYCLINMNGLRVLNIHIDG